MEIFATTDRRWRGYAKLARRRGGFREPLQDSGRPRGDEGLLAANGHSQGPVGGSQPLRGRAREARGGTGTLPGPQSLRCARRAEGDNRTHSRSGGRGATSYTAVGHRLCPSGRRAPTPVRRIAVARRVAPPGDGRTASANGRTARGRTAGEHVAGLALLRLDRRGPGHRGSGPLLPLFTQARGIGILRTSPFGDS